MKQEATISGLLLLLLLTALQTVCFQVARTNSVKPRIYVNPENSEWSTKTIPFGSNFIISVESANWASPSVYSYEMKLQYNNTILEAVFAEYPAGHWLEPIDPTFGSIVPLRPYINQQEGRVEAAFALLGTELGRNGGGTLFTVTFRTTKAPWEGENLSCTLELCDVIMVDPNAQVIPADQYEIINGKYVYFAPLLFENEKPKIYLEPRINTFYFPAKSIGNRFTVGVKTDKWTPPGVYAYALALCYNQTLLEVVSADFPLDSWLLYKGPMFLIYPGPAQIEIFQQEGVVIASSTLLGSELGRVGGGTLFTVTFKTIATPAPSEAISCILEFANVSMVDPDAIMIPPSLYVVANGNYMFSAREDLNHDGRVNILEMTVWAKAFHSHPGEAKWNPQVDLNGDGEINIVDATSLARAWTW